MPVKVKIPTMMREQSGGEPVVEGGGQTVREVLSDIEARYPGLTRRIVTEDGTLHRFVNLYVNGRGRHDLGPPRRRRRLRLRSGGRFIPSDPSSPIAVPATSGHTKGTGRASSAPSGRVPFSPAVAMPKNTGEMSKEPGVR
jgi:molybdopterin converting factor small subunit